MVFVFAVILAALVLFATEAVPVDVTALGVMVALLLVQPLTEQLATLGLLADPVYVLAPPGADGEALAAGLSGFASTATITVLAMFILSAGVRKTGVIQLLGAKIATYTGDSESRQLGATIGLVSPISGFINNTAAVAILLPMVTDLANKGDTSPSKLLLPLSYASMFGGTLTLIGTSTNILASQITARLGRELGNPELTAFSMFEFTSLGIVVMVVGTAYLLTVGRWLTPARIPAAGDLTEAFRMADYLTEVVVREDSPIVGSTVREAIESSEFDVDVVQLIRGDRVFLEGIGDRQVRAGDVFAIRTDRDTLVEVMDADGLDLLPEVDVTETELEAADTGSNLVEIVVAPGSELVGETLASTNFRQRYDMTVLALRRGEALIRSRMDRTTLRVGDTLLVQGPTESVDRLQNNPNVIVAQEVERPDYRRSRIPVAVGIVAAVVALAALTPVHIAVAALGGALAMVLTGCLKATEMYDAVQWDVIVLLAGVIPLGIALEVTGGATLLADLIVAVAPSLPPIIVLGLLYVVTALLTNVISNNASVVLMIPVAVEAAIQLGANAFSFVLAVTFAASTAFMTPVGYQTNLFVYGPGGYRFTDYLRVGGPLQALFAVVTTIGIAAIWGL
ncbi:SLC13 family permease [Halapricum sp. CBA1109]|uniref:SLC13 family permease n=1 Tax=Halapricum sp. CBA1109 TaxID=2668068 RepID=UPI0012F792E9|nr:SLC13 family permease [Halapricum sp. CBA1109]MUV90351.1 SLC13 family permease [Halapricum sp. CBA1109]